MNDFTQEIKFEDYEKLAWKIANEFHRRLRTSARRHINCEDLFQEAAIAFLNARRKFDPSLGNQFSTYFYHSAVNGLSKYVKSDKIQAISLDEERTSDGHGLIDILPSNSPSPEALASRSNHRSFILAKLSDRTRAIIKVLENPPKIVMRELQAVQAKAEHGRINGFGRRQARVGVDLTFVMTVMGLSTSERSMVHSELKAVVSGYKS